MFSTGLKVLAQISQVVNVFGEATTNDFGYVISVDSAGNMMVTGTKESFGAGLDDVFIGEYSSFGHKLWNTTWG